jgi:hypothetical protein
VKTTFIIGIGFSASHRAAAAARRMAAKELRLVRRATLVLAAAGVAAGSSAAAGASSVPDGAAHRCARGTVHAVIGGKHECLRPGARCRRGLDRQYHRYGFHCHSGRLTRAARSPTPQPPSSPGVGRVSAAVAVAEGGGIAIGDDAVWAASFLSRSIVKIDPQTNRVAATVRIGSGSGNDMHPGGVIAAGADGVWVAGDTGHNVLYRVDPATARVVATVRVGADGGRPNDVAVGLGSVWASDSHGGSVVRIDPATNREIARINVVGPADVPFVQPAALGIAAGDVWVNVAGFTSTGGSVFKVVRIDAATNAVEAELETTCGFITDDGTFVWLLGACVSGSTLTALDPRTNTVARTLDYQASLGSVAAHGGIAYGFGSLWVRALRVGGSVRGALARIDPTNGVVGTLPLVGSDAVGFAQRKYGAVAVGFGSVWVREPDRVLRIEPAP